MNRIIIIICIVIDAQGPVATALFLGDQSLFNTTRDDCVWRRGNDRDQCPDPDISMTLYPSKNSGPKSKVHIIIVRRKKKKHIINIRWHFLFFLCHLALPFSHLFYSLSKVDITQRDWLRNSGWDRDKENIILIHGYGGSEDALPTVVLRDGKLKTLINYKLKT